MELAQEVGVKPEGHALAAARRLALRQQRPRDEVHALRVSKELRADVEDARQPPEVAPPRRVVVVPPLPMTPPGPPPSIAVPVRLRLRRDAPTQVRLRPLLRGAAQAQRREVQRRRRAFPLRGARPGRVVGLDAPEGPRHVLGDLAQVREAVLRLLAPRTRRARQKRRRAVHVVAIPLRRRRRRGRRPARTRTCRERARGRDAAGTRPSVVSSPRSLR